MKLNAWKELTTAQKTGPILLIGAYWTILLFLNGLRGDHLAIGGALLLLSYGGKAARKLRKFSLPFFLVAIIYDSQRFYADLIRGPIHVQEPYLFDKFFFGIPTAQGVLTPNEFWQQHLHPALDFIAGLAYLIFFSVFIMQSLYFYFFLGRSGTRTMTAGRAREKAHRMTWSFFWVNMIGYSTYYWYAASPPWYVTLYGLGPAIAHVPANSAGCARFDAMLGTHFFTEMYGRAADVHGAIPSLHVAYPFIAMVFALQFKRQRAFSIFFYLLMCFSAVYLNHHYVLDILWGTAYAMLTILAIDFYGDRIRKRRELLA